MVLRSIAALTLLLLAACQAPVPPTPAATSVPTAQPTAVAKPSGSPSPSGAAAAAPSPSPSPLAGPSPSPSVVPAAAPPVGSSRVAVLNAASAAFARGDLAGAAPLYERVVNTPPSGESTDQTAAIDGLAHFEAMVALLATGHEDQARTHLTGLQEKDANAPFARLASQLWDQYSMVGGVRGACSQVQPEIPTAVGATLQMLQSMGVSVDAQALCKLPSGG
jgi:hypothetical protein